MYKYSRTDFIESNLRTALIENQQLQVSYLTSKRTEFDHHKARLAIVRDEKEKAHLQLLGKGCSIFKKIKKWRGLGLEEILP